MGITPKDPAHFDPAMGDYKDLKPFRMWCQKVLPLVYDDSLSYYEVLCKVVDYLNKAMEDVGVLHGDVEALHEAYQLLQAYVNDYFSTLDVQEEINHKLDVMAEDGTLDELLLPYFNDYKTEINGIVAQQNQNIDNFETTVNGNMTIQNNKISVLESRMDTFSHLTPGSTTGDAELSDIRVAANGITYPTAGDAVRAQAVQNPQSTLGLTEATAYEYGMFYPVAKTLGVKKISANVISDGVKEYTSYSYLPYVVGTNIFDKNNYKNIFSGFYIDNATGIKVEAASYSAFIVPIDATKEILSINSIYTHVAFLSYYVDLDSVALASVVDGYISGAIGSDSPLEGVAIPSSAKYVVISESTTQLSTAQLQYGSECTPYEPFEHFLNVNDIKDNSIPTTKIKNLLEKAKDEFVSYTVGTNLFDKNNQNDLITGYYVGYNNGIKVADASYTTFIVPIDASKETISINSIYTQIAFTTEYIELDLSPVNTPIKGYISGAVGQNEPLEGVEIPSNAKYAVVSISNIQVNNAQLQYGSECTPYEPYEHFIDVNDIKDYSIPVKKIKDLSESLKDEFVSYTVGTNLFDKNNQNDLITGYYVGYNNGVKAENASYTTFIVPIDASKETLSINSTYTQIAFTTEYIDLDLSPVNVPINGYISGALGQNEPLEGVEIPSNAKYAVVSISNTQVNNAQLQYGSECTPYEPYELSIDGAEIKKNSIPPDALSKGYAKSFVVDINGDGDYTSVRACLDYIRNNNISYVNVYIKEGVYNIEADYTSEEKAATSFIGLIVPKNVALVGIGKKENIILTYTATEPTTAISTLNIMENVDIKNMTIKGNNIRYCVHDDYATLETSHLNGNNRNIENVDFIGENLTLAIPYGAGTKGDAKWIFNRVRFINKTSYMCFSVHDAVTETKGADYFEFNECEFIGKGTANIRLSPAQSGFDSEIVFNGCIMQGIRIDSQFTGGEQSTTVYKIYGSGNSKNPRLTYYNNHDKLSFPHFPEICKAAINGSNGVLSTGDYVKFSNGMVISGTSSDHEGIMFNTCNDGEVAYVNISE